MNDDEFNRLRNGTLADYDAATKSALLEATIKRIMGLQEKDVWQHYPLVNMLLDAGTPVPDATVASFFQALATDSRLEYYKLDELVRWLEIRNLEGAIPPRLLTILRSHFPGISHWSADKHKRFWLRRMELALKLVGEEVIPKPVDAWTDIALKWQESLDPASRGAWDALLALADKQKSSNPAKNYLTQAKTILQGLPEFPQIMQAVLASLGSDGPVGVRFRGFPSGSKNYLDDDFTDLLRALIWLCVPFPELIGSLGEAARRCTVKIPRIGPLSSKIAAACLFTLSQQTDAKATQTISEIQRHATNKSTRKGVSKAIAAVEKRSGAEWMSVEESTVRDFGFAMENNPEHQVGNYAVTLGFSKTGIPELLWTDGCSPAISKIPGEAQRKHPAEISKLKEVLREVKKVVKNQVVRLERMLRTGRQIPASVWREHYLGHPLVGPLSRRLLWRLSGGRVVGFEVRQDGSHEMVTQAGAILEIPDSELVELWHPAVATEAERVHWERWVLNRRLNQPFQQALRDSYRPEASSGAQLEELRHAGTLLHQGAFASLAKARGWTYSFHGEAAQFAPFVEFPERNLRAVLHIEEDVQTGMTSGRLLVWLRIVHVKFLEMSTRTPLPLATVPPIVFSEAMRDIDLFIAAGRAAEKPA